MAGSAATGEASAVAHKAATDEGGEPTEFDGGVGATVGGDVEAAVAEAGGETADNETDGDKDDPAIEGVAFATSHGGEVGGAIDVGGVEGIFDEDDDAVDTAGGAEAVTGNEEGEEEEEAEEEAAGIGVNVWLGFTVDKGLPPCFEAMGAWWVSGYRTHCCSPNVGSASMVSQPSIIAWMLARGVAPVVVK